MSWWPSCFSKSLFASLVFMAAQNSRTLFSEAAFRRRSSNFLQMFSILLFPVLYSWLKNHNLHADLIIFYTDFICPSKFSVATTTLLSLARNSDKTASLVATFSLVCCVSKETETLYEIRKCYCNPFAERILFPYKQNRCPFISSHVLFQW